MHDFQVKFFPQIASKLQHYDKETDYCKYSNHWLQTCTSSMYLTALVSTFLASWITDKHGRKLTMFLGGVISLVGAGLTTGAQNLAMIVLGRALMGIAIGFANQVSSTSVIKSTVTFLGNVTLWRFETEHSKSNCTSSRDFHRKQDEIQDVAKIELEASTIPSRHNFLKSGHAFQRCCCRSWALNFCVLANIWLL